jgi:hypothetical protein
MLRDLNNIKEFAGKHLKQLINDETKQISKGKRI